MQKLKAGQFCGLLTVGLFVSCVAAPLFASGQFGDGTRCLELVSALKKNISAQPSTLKLENGSELLVFNREIEAQISKGFSRELLEWSLVKLKNEGTFEIPVNERGVIAAASRGSYAFKAWDRDHLRGIAGVDAAGRTHLAQKMRRAILERYGTDTQLKRIIESLRDPGKHLWAGTDTLPQVVFNPVTLGDSERWSVQKDAWGLYLHSALDGIEKNQISPEDLSLSEKTALLGMFALMVRIQFWNMATTDAWEEQAEVYTSGVALVTGALERLHGVLGSVTANQMQHPIVKMLREIEKADGIPLDVRALISSSLSPQNLDEAVKHGYERIFRQLNAGGEAPQIKRHEDTSLLWLFFYRLKRFQEDDYRRVLALTKPLLREAGMLRYIGPYADGYLNPGQFFDHHEVLPSEMVAVDHPVTGEEVEEAFLSRHVTELEKLFGNNFYAQWSLGILISLQANAKMHKWFPQSAHRNEYEAEAESLFLRTLAMTTPGSSISDPGSPLFQDQAIAIDGRPNDKFRFAEALIPMNLYETNAQGQKVKTGCLWTQSPFCPLNWATSEAIQAIRDLWELKFPDKPFPSF